MTFYDIFIYEKCKIVLNFGICGWRIGCIESLSCQLGS